MSDRICVLVFTCNRPDDLRRCLDSVFKQTYRDFEVLVIDNGDSPETNTILKSFDVKVIKDKTKRLSYLFNLGWKSTDRELLVYLADDAELVKDWIEEALKSVSRNPDAAVITGPLVSPFEYTGEMHALHVKAERNPFLRFISRFYDNFILEGKTFQPCVLCESGSYTIGQGFKPDFKGEREVDLATTSGMLIRRSAIENIGGFDEDFLFNHADGDLFVRLKRKGYRILYNTAMVAYHYNRMGPSRNAFIIGRDTAFFYLKDIRPRSLRGCLAALANICILNMYWVYKAFSEKQVRQLGGIVGFASGVGDFLRIRFFKKQG